ncbi:MAG: acyl-ACP--UDP-N-acetylglucosamine O-acyltransferase [Vicingaceae bacterium]
MNDIHPKARIGQNVSVGSFTSISEDVEIGDGTWIGPNVTIMDGARIGKNCRIFPGAVISAVPQDLKYKGEFTTAEVGDNTTIRECVTINKGTTDRMKTSLGSNSLVMAYSHLAHDCQVGNNVILANNATIAGHVTIEDYSILEGLVAVQQFVRIGAHSFVTGGSLVRKNVPPFVKAAREPLSYAGVNSVGLRRRGFSDQEVHTIEDIYRILFVKGSNLSNAITTILTEIAEGPFRKQILQFIEESPKGIIKAPF